MQSEIQENYKVFDFCLESVRACMCVSLQTCQAVDHSFPPLALSPRSLPHTLFFFLHSTNTGFSLGGQSRGLIYCTVELWDGNASQHKVADGRVCQPSAPMAGDALRVLQMEMICLFFKRDEALTCAALICAVACVEIKALDVRQEPPRANFSLARRKRNKERRASVSSAAFADCAVVDCEVSVTWPGSTCWASLLALALTS